MIKKLSLTILYIALGLFLMPGHALAADYGLTINPPLLRVHIKPGKSITKVFTIENQSSTGKTLIASIVPFTESDDLGNPILDPRAKAPWSSYFSLANSEITLDKPFDLASGASVQLILSLAVPADASLQDIYATLTVSTYQNAIPGDFQGSSVSATIGANMLITISTQPFPDTTLKIVNFHPSFGTYFRLGNIYFVDNITPLKLTALVQNDGNFAAETKGVFRVQTRKGRPVYLEGILPVNVIANSSRQLINTNGGNFEYNPSLSQIGFHQISLEIKTENSSAIGTIEIFFLPLKFGLGLLAAITLVFTILKVSSKNTETAHLT